MKNDFKIVMIKKITRGMWLFLCGFSFFFSLQTTAHAAINLVLTQGVSGAVPIAIVPFAGQENSDSNDSNNIAAVINNDLQDSGRFSTFATNNMPAMPHSPAEIDYTAWQKLKLDDIVVGQVQPASGGQYTVTFSLLDVFKGQNNSAPGGANNVLASQQFTVPASQVRQLAHHISDIIYQEITGQRGIFTTKIAYVLVQRNPGVPPQYSLEVADEDGYNPQAILTSSQPIMSPAWSHDGRKIAYVSFENTRMQIFVSDIATGARTLIAHYPGINGAPAWSPDDQQLAMALSEGTGNPKIYIMNLASHQLQQITQGPGIDTEPSWSPDGKSLLFTSDRGGKPQIYQVNIGSGQIARMTFDGVYNARSSYSPDGSDIVMIHQDDSGGFDIGLQDLQAGAFLALTNSNDDQSPSFSPNGAMVLYASKLGSEGVLGLVSTDGRVKLRLPAREGDVQEPAWSPFLNNS